MDRRFPDTATVETAVALALRAPSAHNAQPWCWRIGYSSLHLFADQDRPLPESDPERRDLLLGCGAALHHVRVAFAALGWNTEVRRCPDDDPAHLAVVAPRPGRHPDEAVALAAAIPRRRSERRCHSALPVPRHHLDAITGAAAREGAELRVVTGTPRRLLLASNAVASYSHAAGRRAGPVLTWPPEPQTDTDGALLFLTTADDDRLARLRAGEATSAVLLSATAPGLSSCALTDPLKTFEGNWATLMGNTPGHPQVALRIGWAPPGAEPPPPTPRRPLGHALEPLQAPPKYHHRPRTH